MNIYKRKTEEETVIIGIAQFIRVAQDCGSVQAIATVLEYQQKRFADLDSLADFTLD